VSRVLKKITH